MDTKKCNLTEEEQANYFIAFNISCRIRDELASDKKEIFLELPGMKEIYKDILFWLLEKDVESLSLIRTCDHHALKELHYMIVNKLPCWEKKN